MPVGAGLGLSAFVTPGFGGGQQEFGDGHVAVQHLHIGVFAQIADERYFVEAAHKAEEKALETNQESEI